MPLNHGFYEYRQMTRWTVCPSARGEILDRLLEENHRRAAQQGEASTEVSEVSENLGGIDDLEDEDEEVQG